MVMKVISLGRQKIVKCFVVDLEHALGIPIALRVCDIQSLLVGHLHEIDSSTCDLPCKHG